MGRFLVPAAMVASTLAFAVAAGAAAAAPRMWSAAVSLAVLGGIIPMIFAVNIRIVPVFARRAWRSEPLLRAQVIAALLGAWLAFAGMTLGSEPTALGGRVLALTGGTLFVANVANLLRQPVGRAPAPPLPFPEQAGVDRIATGFTALAGSYLLVGLAAWVIAAVLPAGRLGRLDLAATHALLLGFFLSMAAGVCYHVLPRWTTRRWRALAPLRWHLWLAAAGLPVMLAALASGSAGLFAVFGPLQAVAVALFLESIAPLVPGLPRPTGAAFAAAAAMLLVGVALGAAFALDPAIGARLRFAHADLNLFGFGGLLVSGAAVYLGPRFAGRPLRWPPLAAAQVGLLAVGVVLAATGQVARASGASVALAAVGHAGIAAAFALLAVVLAGTFTARGRGTVAPVQIATRARSVGFAGVPPADRARSRA